MQWEDEARAVEALRNSRVIVHATEGVFGLGCRALSRTALARLNWIKPRDPSKSFIVVAADFSQVAALVRTEGVDLDSVFNSWPGPETWIFDANKAAPDWLCSAEGTIAVRITAHRQFARLCAAVGPMISTSANVSSTPPAMEKNAAQRYFGRKIAVYLSGVLDAPGRPSRIRRATDGLVFRS